MLANSWYFDFCCCCCCCRCCCFSFSSSSRVKSWNYMWSKQQQNIFTVNNFYHSFKNFQIRFKRKWKQIAIYRNDLHLFIRLLCELRTRKEKSAKHAQLMLEIIGQMIKRVVLWKHKSKVCYSPRPDEKGNETVSFPS